MALLGCRVLADIDLGSGGETALVTRGGLNPMAHVLQRSEERTWVEGATGGWRWRLVGIGHSAASGVSGS